jgi:RNA polymerase sigma factor (sigma-70 family)
MEWITTSTILRELRESSESDAWSRLVTRFRRPIVRFARKMGHAPADAEDVAQETLSAFVEAYRAGRYDRTKGRLSQWLFGIAFRQSQRVRRLSSRAARAADHVEDVDGLAPPDVTDLWEREWEEGMLAECFRRVREEVEPQTFRIFELVVLEGKTPADVGRTLNLPATVVYNSKHRVIARLRRLRTALESIE